MYLPCQAKTKHFKNIVSNPYFQKEETVDQKVYVTW